MPETHANEAFCAKYSTKFSKTERIAECWAIYLNQLNNLVSLHVVAAHIVPNLGALVAAVSPVIACIDVGVVTTILLNQAIPVNKKCALP